MILFPCHVCQTPLSAEDAQAGHLVRCPTCATALRVPAHDPAVQNLQQMASGVPQNSMTDGGGLNTLTAPPQVPGFTRLHPPAGRPSGRRYGFNCGYCSSRLEANETMAAQDGQCPTCGNNITIPILDRYNRLIDPKTHQIIKQDPHPVHAYAAAGERAPKIHRLPDGQQNIECPRCNSISPITANNCRNCGMPFTMEGTTLEAASSSNGFCVASLVLGIIGLPTFLILIPAALAVVFGIVGYSQISKSGVQGGGKGMAIAGIVCGTLGLLFAGMKYM